MGLAATVNSFHKAQEEITRLAHYDSLTNLANRLLLTDRIEQAISIAKRKNEKLALILHDLDEFKPVNDNYGHRVGDLLLRKVAERIKTCIRESDTAGRIGGDEFVIIMPEISHAQDALIVANKIHDALNQPFEIGAITINISTSIGIAIYPDHGLSEEELMVNADNAMYSVKQSGRNTIKIYSPDTKLETNEARRKSQISFG
jgi:diguanylate cyclase (GGDEF)-like protein